MPKVWIGAVPILPTFSIHLVVQRLMIWTSINEQEMRHITAFAAVWYACTSGNFLAGRFLATAVAFDSAVWTGTDEPVYELELVILVISELTFIWFVCGLYALKTHFS